jgi:enoyl-CoA hydratase/carnithine racemase
MTPQKDFVGTRGCVESVCDNMTKQYSSYATDIYDVQVVDEQILIVTLNRPRALNAIPPQYHVKLHRLWNKFENDPKMRVAILTGQGRVFCSGADLKGTLIANPNRP